LQDQAHERLTAAIEAMAETRATTMEGLRCKARASAKIEEWAGRCQLWTMGKSAGMPWRPAAKVPTSFVNFEAEHGGDSHFTISEAHLREPPGFESRAAACSRRPVSLGRNMSKRNRTVFDEGNLEAMVRLREQDEKFCQALRAAIQRGRESRPTGVSTEPCTQRPILNYTRPD
jgi:hypothetical protein